MLRSKAIGRRMPARMSSLNRWFFVAVLTAPSLAPAKGPQLGQLRKVGLVHLPISCAPAVQKDFDRAYALLHSFFYEEARKIFGEVAARDPKCAMAQWGIAMTHWHPLWTPPAEKEMAAGIAAIELAKRMDVGTDLERELIAALDIFYTEPKNPSSGPPSETAPGPTPATHRARAAAYAKAMVASYAHRPEDVETASLYALGLLGSADPLDQTLSAQRKATDMLEHFYADEKLREHPGLLHYLIHGYDYPSVAAKGLPAAKGYAAVAPWVPHALHMPSHIFVRLGMWKEVIEANSAAVDAARKYQAANHPDATSFEELHASDYLMYAYMQTGQDAKAKQIVEMFAKVKRTYPEVDFAATYAMSAVPARYAIDRRDWAAAATLAVPPGPWWAKFPFGEANLVFAKALGAARTGKLDEAKAGAARIQELLAGSTDPRFQYFVQHARVQQQMVLAWIAFAEGKKDDGVAMMREAAGQDDAIGKHPVSPGSIVPARELLADMLLEVGKNDEALAEYEACSTLNPKRLVTIYGAGLAARRAGRTDIAKARWKDLASFAPAAKSRKPIAEAFAFARSK
jgi:tetratricopeptide (TPR) repeat protein